MDFTTANATIKTLDTDTESPSPPDPKPNFSRSLSLTNGAPNPHHRPAILPPPQQPTVAVAYKECLKNHAASIGGHALDGCGEFMPSPASSPLDPASLKCAACGCHRNFHRQANQNRPRNVLNHHHRCRLLPAPRTTPSPSPSSSPGPTLSPQSPPPVSHLPPSYFASPPQMLLALSAANSAPSDEHHLALIPAALKTENKYVANEKKRSRTKFTQEQKEKMCLFADKVGWKMHRSDERMVEEFCKEVGVGRGVLKVWMHNNKHGMKKRSERSAGSEGGGGGGGQQMMINSNVKYEITNGDEGFGREGFDSMNVTENAKYNVNANAQNEGSRASFHLSNNGSSSSS